MRVLIAVAAVALASAANPAIVLQMPNDEDNKATISWDGDKLSIPGHTEELAGVIADAAANTEAIEKLSTDFTTYINDEQTQDHITVNIQALKDLTATMKTDLDNLIPVLNTTVTDLAALRADFDAYVLNQASEDHNTVDVQALQDMVVNINTEISGINEQVKGTPLQYHASQCSNGDVDLDAKKCTCHQSELQPRFSAGSPNPKGTYVSGAAYPVCQVCSNLVCGSNQYRAGSCDTDAGNSFSCKNCANTECSAGKYRTGSCGTVYKHTSRRRQNTGIDHLGNNYQCTDCDNKTCGAGKYRDGKCGTIWASRRRNLQNHNAYTCKNCPAGQYSSNGNSNGISACTKCPTGKMTVAGQATCTKCAAGKTVKYDQRRRRRGSNPTYEIGCNNCPTGLYQNEEHKDSCKSCPSGKAASTAGLTSCSQCNAGKYVNADQRRRRRGSHPTYNTCNNCGAGQTSATGGSCTKCPTGKAAVAGQSPCAECATGKYVTKDQRRRRRGSHPTYETGCNNCGVTQYQDQQHQASCKQCSNKYANAKSAATACGSNCPSGKSKQSYANGRRRRSEGYNGRRRHQGYFGWCE